MDLEPRYADRSREGSSVWSTAMNSSSTLLSLACSDYMYVVSLLPQAGLAATMPQPEGSRDCAWLTEVTLAYGHTDVKLWDLRSNGVVTRFGRRKTPITGIRTPNHHGVQLLVSDNKEIQLFDTRKMSGAIMSFRHVHEGPQLQFDVNESLQLIAAVDVENRMQTYSIPTGRAITLDPTRTKKRRPRWMDDTTLQVCQGNALIRWTWGGNVDDEWTPPRVNALQHREPRRDNARSHRQQSSAMVDQVMRDAN
jgi:hypothetical protein